MDQETQKLVDEQFKKLPLELQKAIDAVPWKASLKEIALLNNMSPEKIELFERETMFILYGFEKPEDYTGNLVRELEISEETAISIAEAVEKKIFEEITLKTEPSSEKASEIAPEVIHNNLPMVEEGEVAHTVPHVEEVVKVVPMNKPEPEVPQPVAPQQVAKPQIPEAPKITHYEKGKDPYREPLV